MSNRAILVAVSGGVDSMVLLHYLFHLDEGVRLGVAHCNFQLRAEESDEDERLVQSYCETHDIPFWSKRFDTRTYAQKEGKSIQEAARDLRYAWFEEIMNEQDFQSVATAHHRQDSIETFFINLMRGSGPKGLAGISEGTASRRIRPLMEWSKEQILQYAQKKGLEWREDASNTSRDYLRNRVRTELLPLLRDMRSGFDEVMVRNMQWQEESAALWEKKLCDFEQEALRKSANGWRIKPQKDRSILLLYLRKKGFSYTQINDILNSQQAGKYVQLDQLVLSWNKGDLCLEKKLKNRSEQWSISSDLHNSSVGHGLEMAYVDVPECCSEKGAKAVCLCVSQLNFPLVLRYWMPGDRIRLEGMKGRKKISDLLTDMKLSRGEKERTKVLLSGEEIVWVLGIRRTNAKPCSERKGPFLCIREQP